MALAIRSTMKPVPGADARTKPKRAAYYRIVYTVRSTSPMSQLPQRVIIADQADDLSIEHAELPGVEIIGFPSRPDQTLTIPSLLEAVREQPAPVLIVWSGGTIDRDALETLASLGVHGIVCASVGYNHVDLVAAADLGLTICNVPDYGTDEVADHALSLLLWCLRRLGVDAPSAADPRAFWSNRHAPLRRLSDSTLALLGFGRIGQAVARRAESFGLRIRWYDPYVARGQEKVTRTTRAESVAELLHNADALSIHCQLTAETRGMVNAETLAMLPSRAVVVNTARGPVVQEEALLAALRSGHLEGAALDVLEHEPPGDRPLFAAYMRGELPQLLISPHVAWYSAGSAAERKRKAAAEAGRLLRGETPYNAIRAIRL
jgi:phosphoglycerate dehydrogenase-like enzyme